MTKKNKPILKFKSLAHITLLRIINWSIFLTFRWKKSNKTKHKTLFFKMETATESGNPEGLIVLKKKPGTI